MTQAKSQAKSKSQTPRSNSSTANPVEQALRPLAAAQDAGFRAATGVAQHLPGLPRAVGAAAVGGGTAWVRTYFGAVQLLVDSERRVAEQLLALNGTLLAPRLSAAQREHLRSV
jgi:hypothetical protein